MKSVKFIIVENEAPDYRSTREQLLQIGALAANIWPASDSQLFNGWSEVGKTLTRLRDSGWNPAVSTVVLLLDLALDSADSDFARGVQAIINGYHFYRDYATVVCTRAAPSARPELVKYVDGIFHKGEQTSSDDRQARFAKVVRCAIRAVEKRRGGLPTLTIESFANVCHDLPYLSFISSYSEDILLEVIEAVTEGVTRDTLPTLTVASGGFSGAAILLFEYKSQRGGSRQVAVKLSRDLFMLQDEFQRLKEVQKASHKFDDFPIQLVHGVCALPGYPDVFYVQQHFANGRTLESALVGAESIADVKPISTVLNSSLNFLLSSGLKDRKSAPLSEIIIIPDRLRLSFLEVGKQLRLGIRLLESNANFKSRFSAYLGRVGDLEKVVCNWQQYCDRWAGRPALCFEQHGDMNPRNIVVIGSGREVSLRLIDFARFGLWPAFYDLVRLRLQVALRLLDPTSSMREIFPERIILWDRAFWNNETPNGLRKAFRKEFVWYQNFIEISSMLQDLQAAHLAGLGEDANHAKLVVQICMLNEVLRLVCYEDTAWTKRIWFLLVGARLLSELPD